MSVVFYQELNRMKKNSPPLPPVTLHFLILDIIHGYPVPTGHPINESLLYILMLSFDEHRDLFSTEEQEEVQKWILAVANAQQQYHNTNSSTINNWLAHQIKTVSIAGDVLRDKMLADWGHSNLIFYIDNNLYADGSCLDFQQRDSLTYHTYSLNALVLAAVALQHFFYPTMDYYHYTGLQGGSFKKSIDFLIPYQQGTSVNLMFIKSMYSSDKIIHADQHGKPWPKEDSDQLLLHVQKLILETSKKV